MGIPTTPTIALLMGAFLMNGLVPGPTLFVENPQVVWGVIASLYVGNVMLIILNLPLVGLWVSVLRIPYAVLFGLILAFCLVGAFSIDGRGFDVGVMILFGVLGYIFRKLDFPLAPMALTLILGPIMERALRNSLELSNGDFFILFTRPISGTLLALAGIIILTTLLRLIPRGRGIRRIREEGGKS
jgi:putative tricarboxylic transport membrane protein